MTISFVRPKNISPEVLHFERRWRATRRQHRLVAVLCSNCTLLCAPPTPPPAPRPLLLRRAPSTGPVQHQRQAVLWHTGELVTSSVSLTTKQSFLTIKAADEVLFYASNWWIVQVSSVVSFWVLLTPPLGRYGVTARTVYISYHTVRLLSWCAKRHGPLHDACGWQLKALCPLEWSAGSASRVSWGLVQWWCTPRTIASRKAAILQDATHTLRAVQRQSQPKVFMLFVCVCVCANITLKFDALKGEFDFYRSVWRWAKYTARNHSQIHCSMRNLRSCVFALRCGEKQSAQLIKCIVTQTVKFWKVATKLWGVLKAGL